MFRDEHMNSYTIFQSAQLLERLRALARRWFQLHEFQQCGSPKRVDPLMPQQGMTPKAFVSHIRVDGWEAVIPWSFAREIESDTVTIDHDFDLVQRRNVGWI